MGCDIHLYVERRVDGKWVTADKWTPNKYAGEEGEPPMALEYDDRFYTGRNYNLFAILADVRNGHGFAGIKTSGGFVPIAEPRGIPDDACPEYRAESERYGEDGHSHSYFTVAELLTYDWTQVSCLQGWVDGKNFEEFERYRKRDGDGPSEYCGGVSGKAIEHISNEEMRAYVKQAVADKSGNAWTHAIETLNTNKVTLLEWTQTYAKCCKHFLADVMPRLWQLGKPDDVRIVFFFDN